MHVVRNKALGEMLKSVIQLLRGPASLRPLLLILTKKADAPKTFREFNMAMFGDGSAKMAIDGLGHHVDLLTRQLSQVKVLFDLTSRLTADRIVPRIELLMKNGQFESRLSTHADGAHSLFFESDNGVDEDREEVPQANIQDLIKGSTVFLKEVRILTFCSSFAFVPDSPVPGCQDDRKQTC